MLFNSLHFLVFFPIVALAYFALTAKWRWALLLAASYYFYMAWKVDYVVLLLAATVINYFAALKMGSATNERARKTYLVLGVTTSLGILFFYKYFNLFSDTLRATLETFSMSVDVPHLNVLLPVGISFYTFQTLSYTIDVYRREKEPERHFGIFALYVSFFPQLVAGPIERSTRLLPQFYRTNDFEYQRVTSGLKLMAWGFFKKLVIADRVAAYANQVYTTPTDYTGAPLVIATVLFAYQIYCDFSAYSDIAIGASRVLGYDLMENFRQPYFSRSIREFWRRWHISLSTWFRDYFYIALGGNRVGYARWQTNLFLTFLISGIWHGANWTFAMWGALHGFYLIVGNMTQSWRERMSSAVGLSKLPLLHEALRWFTTFSLVMFAWIFFRANTISDAFYVVGHLFTDFWACDNIYLDMGAYEFWIGVAAIGLLEAVHTAQRYVSVGQYLASKPAVMRFGVYYACVLCILIFGEFGGPAFLYFQF